MLRRCLSLALPLMLSVVVGLSYLHFRQQAAEAAPADGLRLAQAGPADPFAPPAPVPAPRDPFAPVPRDPAIAPPAPVVPRAVPPAGSRLPLRKKPLREVPRSDDEVRTPFLRNLLGQLDTFAEVPAAERDGVRQMLYEADIHLSDSMGPAARQKIEAANQRRPALSLGTGGPRQAFGPPIRREEVLRARDPRQPVPPVAPPRRADPFRDDPLPPTPPPAVPPVEPEAAPLPPDPVDNLFDPE